MIRAGVVGFTGYSGAELIEILQRHPNAEPVLLEHRAQTDSERPAFDDGLERAPFSAGAIGDANLDVVFLATSAEVSIESAPMLLDAGIKVIDLSAAFRLRTVDKYQRWYKIDHPRPDLLMDAVYGLPEFFRNVTKVANLVANPGCYPTAVNLALRPLIVEAVLDRSAGVICDAKSGVSGAGRKPSLKTHFCEATEKNRFCTTDKRNLLSERTLEKRKKFVGPLRKLLWTFSNFSLPTKVLALSLLYFVLE